jgi:hypothetical protein
VLTSLIDKFIPAHGERSKGQACIVLSIPLGLGDGAENTYKDFSSWRECFLLLTELFSQEARR